MRKFSLAALCFAVISFGLTAGCDSEPPIAGSMSEQTVCNTAGYLIRQRIGKAIKTIDQPCSVKSIDGNNVEIHSGYLPPSLPKKPIRYIAKGYVEGNTLSMNEIKVIGVHDKFVPFGYW